MRDRMIALSKAQQAALDDTNSGRLTDTERLDLLEGQSFGVYIEGGTVTLVLEKTTHTRSTLREAIDEAKENE